MASYKVRLSADLDRWIADGLVPETSREPILAGVAEPRRLEASAALAVVGGLLAGVAVIAFVAANWSGIPRIGRFALVLAIFLAVSGAAAWCAERRPLARNVLLLVASLVFAAAIGLTGQIFDIAGEPRAALHAAGVGAALLALSGRSSAAFAASLLFIAIGDAEMSWLGDRMASPPWLALAGPAGVALAWVWRSKPLAHAAAIALPVAALYLMIWGDVNMKANLEVFGLALAFGGLAAIARWLEAQDHPVAGVAYGWWAWAMLGFFAAAGLGPHGPPVLLHRGLWLALAGGITALGLHDRRPPVTAAGAVFLAGAIATILFDLGLGLMSAAAVFAVVAAAALAGGLALRRRARA